MSLIEQLEGCVFLATPFLVPLVGIWCLYYLFQRRFRRAIILFVLAVVLLVAVVLMVQRNANRLIQRPLRGTGSLACPDRVYAVTLRDVQRGRNLVTQTRECWQVKVNMRGNGGIRVNC